MENCIELCAIKQRAVGDGLDVAFDLNICGKDYTLQYSFVWGGL